MDLLSRLPAELKLRIAETYITSPQDIFNLATTSKDNWSALSTEINRQKALATKWHATSSKRNERMLWIALEAIFDDPHVAWHIRQLELDSNRANSYTLPAPEEPGVIQYRQGPTQERALPYVRAAENNPFLNMEEDKDDDSNNVEDAIMDGAETAYSPLLLFLLPRLKVWKFVNIDMDCLLLTAFRRYCEASATTAPNALPFQHLKKVYIVHDDMDLFTKWEWAMLVVQIPTVEYFFGQMLGGGGLLDILGDDCSDPDTGEIKGPEGFLAKQPTSNLKELTLAGCNIPPPCLMIILSYTKNLQRFSYENGGASQGDGGYDPTGTIAVVDKYCSESLKHLSLEVGSEGENRWGDMDESERTLHPLTNFKQLQTFRCDVPDVLLPAERNDSEEIEFDPASLFPPTLESIHIEPDEDYCDSSEDMAKVYGSLLNAKSDALPALRHVYIPKFDEETYEDLKAQASEKGIKVARIPKIRHRKDVYYAEINQ